MVVLVAVVLILVLLGFVGYPLLLNQGSIAPKRSRKRKDRTSKPGSESGDVEASLRQLEIDLTSGAISEEDYIELKIAYERARRQGRAQGGRNEAEAYLQNGGLSNRDRASAKHRQTKCAACGASVKESNKFCPECGRPTGNGR